jgi:hypothetical protein
MSQDYGISASSPRRHAGEGAPDLQPPARYLVVIDNGGSMVARLLLESRKQVAEFDAGSEEVAVMTRGLQPAHGAAGPEWDEALHGHSAEERRGARVYTLDV